MTKKPTPGTKDKVVSIVPKIARKRAAQAQARAATTHARKDELAATFDEGMSSLDAMDVDAALATLTADGSPEAQLAWAQLRSARAYQSCKRGDPQAGDAEWDEVIAAQPTCAVPYASRAHWRSEADPAAAIPDISRALELDPNNASYYAHRGDYHRVLGDEDRAFADYRRALSLDPELADVHYTMGVMFASRGRYAEARAAFSRAINIAPRYVEYFIGRGAALRELGDHEGAIRDFEHVLELDPSRDDIRCERARCFILAGKPDQIGELTDIAPMVALLERGAELIGDTPETHDLHTAVGAYYLKAGDQDKALAAFERALALAPDDVKALAGRGQIRLAMQEFQGSLDDLDRALALAPDEASYHVERAKALAKLERMADAVVAASRAIELAPRDAFARWLRAVCRSHAEGEPSFPVVRADLRHAAELEPDQAIYRRQYIDCATGHGAVFEVLDYLDQALSRSPTSAELFYERAACRSRVDETLHERDIPFEETKEETHARLTAVLADAEQALDLGKCDEEIYFELVRAREGLGDKDAYLRELDRAVAAFPDDIGFRLLREGQRRWRGDVEGAAEDHARLLELGFKFD